MSSWRRTGQSASQLPSGADIYLDHVGHFIASPEEATMALRRAGFAPTPVSVQVNQDPAGGAPRPTGTGNVCAMLRAGYLEMLHKTADTPLGLELDTARARYSGLHLVAFAVADAEYHHRRLAADGFAMQPLVKMQRPVATADGKGTAAFEVVRVAPGQMREGRVQMLLHKTEDTVWQPRWLTHPNGAIGLNALSIVVADVAEAADRFARFTGRGAVPIAGGVHFALERGRIELMTRDAWHARFPTVELPTLPFMGACEIAVTSLAAIRELLLRGALEAVSSPTGSAARFPPELGHGVWTFVEAI